MIQVNSNPPTSIGSIQKLNCLSGQRARKYFKNLLIGVTAPTICTLICWPLRDLIGHASILLTFLLGVFLVASRYGKGASILASLLSAPAFAYFFARPYFSIAIYDIENVIGLLFMMVFSYITGGLLEKAQFQAKLAEQRVIWTDFLYQLSRNLANAKNSKDVVTKSKESIGEYFKTQAAIYLSGPHNDFNWQLFNNHSDEFDDSSFKEAQHAFESGEIFEYSNYIYYPLTYSQGSYGILVIPDTANQFIPFMEQETYIDSLTRLITQTLERLTLEVQAREAALQADCEMLRNSLLSSISHDLRTPLTRIIGAAGTLLEGNAQLSSNDRQYLKLVMDESEHMSELTEKLLNMAKLASGQIVLHREWNAIEEIVGSVLNRLDKNLSGRPVRTHLPDRLPLIWVDAVLIEQVLLNLIENAIKYTPLGSPIDIEASSYLDRLHLSVIDYGPGLAKEKLTRLFDKFYRGNPESEQSGVGLGLALCKAIIEAHGGQILATNRESKGAEFMIDLPLVSEPSTAEYENSSECKGQP